MKTSKVITVDQLVSALVAAVLLSLSAIIIAYCGYVVAINIFELPRWLSLITALLYGCINITIISLVVDLIRGIKDIFSIENWKYICEAGVDNNYKT